MREEFTENARRHTQAFEAVSHFCGPPANVYFPDLPPGPEDPEFHGPLSEGTYLALQRYFWLEGGTILFSRM
jgi:hypothetical protein